MNTFPPPPSRNNGTPATAAANFGLVALSLGVMAVILGIGAIVVPSVAVMLSIAVLVEAFGTFYFARRAGGDSLNANPSSKPRIARGLAVLGVVLAAVSLGPVLF